MKNTFLAITAMSIALSSTPAKAAEVAMLRQIESRIDDAITLGANKSLSTLKEAYDQIDQSIGSVPNDNHKKHLLKKLNREYEETKQDIIKSYTSSMEMKSNQATSLYALNLIREQLQKDSNEYGEITEKWLPIIESKIKQLHGQMLNQIKEISRANTEDEVKKRKATAWDTSYSFESTPDAKRYRDDINKAVESAIQRIKQTARKDYSSRIDATRGVRNHFINLPATGRIYAYQILGIDKDANAAQIKAGKEAMLKYVESKKPHPAIARKIVEDASAEMIEQLPK